MKLMHQLSFFLIVFFCSNAYSQIPEKIQDWTSLSQSIDVSTKAGYEFRVTAAMRMENGRQNSVGSLWARVDKKDGTTGFFLNASDSIKATGNWKIYEIKGAIGENPAELNIGAYCQNGGDFYFDDFKLEMRRGKEKWQVIALGNPGFEDVDSQNKAWRTGTGGKGFYTVKNFDIDYSGNKPFKGNRSLHISSHNLLGSNDNGKYANVNGMQLYYETYGEGEPLLMIHGNGGSMAAFINQIDVFAKQYKVILVDCRGRGNSSYPPDVNLDFDVQVEDISQFLDELNISKTSIIGWSDGGIIGLLMALQHPEKVDKLVCMGANIFPDGCVGSENMAADFADMQKKNKNHKNDLAIDLFRLDMLYPQLKFDDLKAIKSKTLIMAGDHDLIRAEHTLKIYQSIPGAELAIMPNETHFVMLDDSQVFNEIVWRFLRN